jgi:hypothetical protein
MTAVGAVEALWGCVILPSWQIAGQLDGRTLAVTLVVTVVMGAGNSRCVGHQRLTEQAAMNMRQLDAACQSVNSTLTMC